MKYAIEHGYRYVLNMDADFSHQPKYLPALLAGMEPAEGPPVDVMIGSRYVPGGGVEGWPLKRQLMSRGGESLRPLAARPTAEGLQRGVSLLSHGDCWPSSISTRSAAAATRSRRRFSGA